MYYLIGLYGANINFINIFNSRRYSTLETLSLKMKSIKPYYYYVITIIAWTENILNEEFNSSIILIIIQ